jgi:Uma2 family endonuclease
MSTVTHRPATYEDLIKLPDNVVGEILDGELHASPRPGPRHARAESALHARLFSAFDDGTAGPGGWWILVEPELHFRSDVLVPDIAGWRRERMSQLPETAWFEIAPDWICEVISPSTGRIDRAKKLPVYARERVPHAWLVDPIQKTVEVLQHAEGLWNVLHVYSGDEQMSAPPFDGITIDLRAVWGEPAE